MRGEQFSRKAMSLPLVGILHPGAMGSAVARALVAAGMSVLNWARQSAATWIALINHSPHL